MVTSYLLIHLCTRFTVDIVNFFVHVQVNLLILLSSITKNGTDFFSTLFNKMKNVISNNNDYTYMRNSQKTYPCSFCQGTSEVSVFSCTS